MPLSRPARWAVGFLALAAAATGTLAQPGGGTDRVYFRDRKADGSVTSKAGKITESPAGIKIEMGKDVLVVPAADVVRVEYGTPLAGLENADRQTILTFDSKAAPFSAKDAADGKAAFAALAKKNLSDERTRRVVEYREAVWAARAADFKVGDDFKKEAVPAADKLKALVQSAAKGWEPYPAARLAARLYSEAGKPADAAAVLGTLGKLPGLPPDLKAEAKAAELAALYRGPGKLSAESLAAEYGRDKDFPATGPARDKLTVYQAVVKATAPKDGKPVELIKVVEAVIAKTADGGTRAAARNALGEFYLANGRPRDAMWEFLWVETVFNTDRDEVIHAVSRLAEVFDKMGDKDRADAYRKKLPDVRTGA